MVVVLDRDEMNHSEPAVNRIDAPREVRPAIPTGRHPRPVSASLAGPDMSSQTPSEPSRHLPPGYQPILDAAVQVFRRDDRVRAAWVHGSVARGDADEVSDLDVILAVDDSGIVGFGAGWRERLAEITLSVMARASFGNSGSWLSITPDARRFDLWVEPASQVARSPVTDRFVLLDRDGLDGSVPLPREPAPTSLAKLDELRSWASDCGAIQSVSDELMLLECTHTYRWILYTAMVEMNRPLPASGLKQWSAKLPPEQRRLFSALPTDDPEPAWNALGDVLGPIPISADSPDLGRACVVPEGVVRGLNLLDIPAGERVRHITEELLALHLYLTVIAYRDDWLLGVEGIYSLRRLLCEFFLESDGRRDLTGGTHWSERLSDERRQQLLALPTGRASREAVVGGHLLLKQCLCEAAREVLGKDFPGALERTVDGAVARYR